MDFLTIVGSFALWAFLIFGVPTILMFFTMTFNDHCQEQFGHRFFTVGAFACAAVAAPCLYFGWKWYSVGGDHENDLAMMGFGAAFAAYLYWRNIKHTNMSYGIGGTTAVLVLLGALSFFSAILSVLIIIGGLYALFETKPVYVINNKR